MKRLITIAVLACLATVPPMPMCRTRSSWGWRATPTSKVESNFITDPKSKIDEKNSLFTVQYTHFFTPLKDDDNPSIFGQFYQHLSTLSAGLAFMRNEGQTTHSRGSKPTRRGVQRFSSSEANILPRTRLF